jgi:sulfur carrier protein
MTVFVNNMPNNTTAANLEELVKQLNVDAQQGVAIAVNNNVISKPDWHQYLLAENDKIIIIKAAAGG